MCRTLIELLDIPAPGFRQKIDRLEAASQNPRADIKLATEVMAKAQAAVAELGLDSADSSGQEIYHALNDLAKQQNELLVKAIGAEAAEDTYELSLHAKRAIDKLQFHKSCWALKHSVAKRLLAENPPKAIMKNLGYRSVDSLLKRESVVEIFAALPLVQSSRWLENFYKSYNQLTPSDFAQRPIEIMVLSPERLKQLTNDQAQKQTSICLKELGAVVISLPHRRYLNGLALATITWLSRCIRQMRQDSSYLKLQQVKTNFGNLVRSLVERGHEPVFSLGEQDYHWSQVHNHLSSSDVGVVEALGPHLQSEDLVAASPEEILSLLHPSFIYWDSLESTASNHNSQVVSFNLMDVAVNYVNHLDYKDRSLGNFRKELWSELNARYLEPAHEQLIQHITANITNTDEVDSFKTPITKAVQLNVETLEQMLVGVV